MLKVVVTALVAALAVSGTGALVNPELKNVLGAKGTANIFLTLKDGPGQIVDNIGKSGLDRNARLNQVHSSLSSHASKTQAPITSFLSDSSLDFKSFWITNQIYIKNADSELVAELASRFADILSSIDEEAIARIDKPFETKMVTRQADENEWGIKKIQAPEAWEHIGGLVNAGEGVVVGTCDTGVRVSHVALRDNYVGDYGWFDPSTKEPLPTDNNGHGTHTTGTIAGGKGIGVAPKSKWCACRGCASFFCSQSDLIACGQFFACPTLADGSNADCSKAPHIVSNSWGGAGGSLWYDEVIRIYHVTGIIPVFSIGNNGPSCQTAGSPGDRDVIGVGSTMNTDAISSFSSAGPSRNDTLKPDISAPGSDVVSAYHTDDEAYASLSGTSMACPHTAGVIALLHTRNKNLSYDHVRGFLLENTDKEMQFTGRVCGGVADNVFPNPVFGHGRLNALKSVRAQTNTMAS